jgi:exodeoxyribonuclease V alpha subunit
MCVEVPHTHKFLQNGFSGWNSQGQEYDVIVIPILNTFGRQLQRNLLYTAITRAKKKVLVVGQISALTKAVQNDSAEHRRTLLADRIMCLNGVSADIPAQ